VKIPNLSYFISALLSYNIFHSYIAELQSRLQSYEIREKRMQEAFRSTSQEFRDVCYVLLGYRIDRIKPKLYRLSNMYAESPDDHLIFEVCRTTELPFTLLKTVWEMKFLW
jgi:Mitotic checkpoint protein.